MERIECQRTRAGSKIVKLSGITWRAGGHRERNILHQVNWQSCTDDRGPSKNNSHVHDLYTVCGYIQHLNCEASSIRASVVSRYSHFDTDVKGQRFVFVASYSLCDKIMF